MRAPPGAIPPAGALHHRPHAYASPVGVRAVGRSAARQPQPG